MFSQKARQSVQYDMHTHSDRSRESKIPGRLLLLLAKQRGLHGVGICESDTFPDETLFRHAARLKIRLALGIEFSCRDADIIGYGMDLSSKDRVLLKEHFELFEGRSTQRAHILVERLHEWDRTISVENVSRFAGKAPHFALLLQYMVQERRMFPTVADARRFIKEEGLDNDLPPLRLLDPVEVVELIRRSGGVSIWAHPFMSPPDKQRTLMSKLADAGLNGVEAVYPYRQNGYQGDESNEILQARTLSLVKGTDVFLSGGSDCRYPAGPFEEARSILPGEFGITSQEAESFERVLH